MVTGFHTMEDNLVLGQPMPVFLLGALRICRRSSFRLCDQESGQPVPFYCKALALQSAKHAHMPVVCCIPAQRWVDDPFVSQAKQLHTVADHLHKRINAQDKMIQQLHNDIDAMSRDKKKAIAKYQKAQKELDDLPVTQPAVGQELPDYNSTSTRPQRHYAMHVSVGLAALCTWWYYLQDAPALERKLLSVLLSPVRSA
ncbi:TPA: hypothetical protein ACH3X1_004490 [Trebouxia sp. C0004]